MDDGGDDEYDESDPDRTMVDDEGSSPPRRAGGKALRKSTTATTTGGAVTMMSTFSAVPTLKRMSSSFSQHDTAAGASLEDPTPEQAKAMSEMHAFRLKPEELPNYYQSRFSWLQQDVCKLIVKAWIKVIEPKKQNKFPYNKGDSFKPEWWPEGVRHREPDHLHKQGKPFCCFALLASLSLTFVSQNA